jgi:clan AA aspartic protease
MGEIVVDVELQNAVDRGLAERGVLQETEVRRTTVSAVADTGALMLTLPEDVVSRLGVEVVDSGTFTYADGRRGELPIAGPLTVRIGDRWTFARCVVVPPDAEPLIGQLVMEELDLVADCRNQTLGPRPESPDSPVLRL